MKNKEDFVNILNKIFKAAQQQYEMDKGEIYFKENLLPKQIMNVEILIANAENQKSVIAVIITSLLKKIESPAQDVRLHRSEFKDGYSGRTLDTNVVTPWLKKHFRRFAPKESGWLTRSIEQPHPFTKDFPGKIRNTLVKAAFLSIFEDVEEKGLDQQIYLTAFIIRLLDTSAAEKELVDKSLVDVNAQPLTIDVVIDMLREHFTGKVSSRLPVVATYSIYQLLVENVKIYQDKKLLPLKGHTTSDRYMGYGDIEILAEDETSFEVVEVKHNIPIDRTMISDVYNKIKDTKIKRYFILTTAEPNFSEDRKEIFELVREIKGKFNIEIIPNGIIPSLKYYLRFVPNLGEFLEKYKDNLKKEFSQSTEIKQLHISKWKEIQEKYCI